MNLKKADLTTPQQKVVAAGILAVVLIVLWIILPPLVVLFKNLLLLAVFSFPFLIIAIFPQAVWSYCKQLSWELTKKIISSNKLWHLYRGHEYMVEQMDKLSTHINAVSSIKKRTEKEVAAVIEETKTLEIQEQNAKDELTKKIFQSKAGSNQNLIDTLLPKIDLAKAQEEQMLALLEVWRFDSEIMKHKIDGLSRQYELMKELNSASKAAGAFMRRDTPEMKMFNESVKQVEQSIAEFTTNVESFNRDVMPTLAMASSKGDLIREEGLKTIEEYRAKRLAK